MTACDLCGSKRGKRRLVANETTFESNLTTKVAVDEVALCDACWFRPLRRRPLSPFESLTGERFDDHLTAQDAELDGWLDA